MNYYYDVVIVGSGPGGIFAAYELVNSGFSGSVAVVEKGKKLNERKCPVTSNGVQQCVNCKVCSIMHGFGGAGAFSDGKYNITNDFGGTLGEHVGHTQATDLMEYVDKINLSYLPESASIPKLFRSSENEQFRRLCIQNGLTLLNADIRHLGTDLNVLILNNIYDDLKDRVDFFFETEVESVNHSESGYQLQASDKIFNTKYCILSVGRSGSEWLSDVCSSLGIKTISNKVDIGVRVELPAVVFEDITSKLYEGKIVYRTKTYEDNVRTFCMNPHGYVVSENTDGVISVNGHSFSNPELGSDNTNFALLVSKHMSEPFSQSNEYGRSIVKLSNMLGGGVMVQRFGDLIRGRRTNENRLKQSTVIPTLAATPGDLSLVLPKRILDGIIEMIYALDRIAPGTANDDTLLYGVEVKFYNMNVEVDDNLETNHKGLYVIGDGSGVTHSLSQASASGIYVADQILKNSVIQNSGA